MMNPEEFLTNLMMHREPLHDMLDKVPEGKEATKAFDDGMSISKTAFHILMSAERTASMLTQAAPEKPDPDMSFTEIKTRLRANTEVLQAALPKLSEEQLNSKISAFGGEMPTYKLLEIFRDHEVHHKGQLWTLARMADIDPGSLMKFG